MLINKINKSCIKNNKLQNRNQKSFFKMKLINKNNKIQNNNKFQLKMNIINNNHKN